MHFIFGVTFHKKKIKFGFLPFSFSATLHHLKKEKLCLVFSSIVHEGLCRSSSYLRT